MASIPKLPDVTRELVSNQVRGALDVDVADPGGGMLKAFEPSTPNYGAIGVREAIKNKAKRLYDDELSKIRAAELYSQPDKAMSKIRGAFDLSRQVHGFDQARAQAFRQRRMDEEAQRSALLSSILGLGGTAVGAAYGGPAGAAVGGMAGGQAGQALGGSPNSPQRI